MWIISTMRRSCVAGSTWLARSILREGVWAGAVVAAGYMETEAEARVAVVVEEVEKTIVQGCRQVWRLSRWIAGYPEAEVL